MSKRFRYGILVVFPAQFITIAESIVGILTLGYHVPTWSLNWLFKACQWYSRKFRNI